MMPVFVGCLGIHGTIEAATAVDEVVAAQTPRNFSVVPEGLLLPVNVSLKNEPRNVVDNR